MKKLFASLVPLCAAACVGDTANEIGERSAPLRSVTWTDLVGVSASGNDLTKTAPETLWNAGAASVESLSGDGYVEFTTGEANTGKMAGLSSGNGGASAADIDFAIQLNDMGNVAVVEGGQNRGTFASYAAGDVFRVQVVGVQVTYWKNGQYLYTSAVAATLPLLVDSSLRTPGATLRNAFIQSTAFWQDVVGATASGNDLVKTASENTWNAGAASVGQLDSDGFVRFTTGEITTDKIAGLSSGNTNQSLSDIDFGIRLTATGRINIVESGVTIGSFGAYRDGDLFEVRVVGGVVTYTKNGGLLYTSLVAPPSFPLVVDTSLRTPGATIEDVAFGRLDIWTSPANVAVDGRNLTKTGTVDGYNAGAVSVDTLDGNGYVEFRPGDAVSDVVAGLSHGSGNASKNEIDHGIQLGADGYFGVVENGTFIRNYGTYTESDSFQVQVSGGVVTYFKDRHPFYTSTAVPSFPLLLDSSIKTPGASILDGRVVAGEAADSCLAVQQTLPGETDPYYSSYLDGAGDVMVWTEYHRSPGVVRVHRRGPGGWQLEQRIVRADWEPIFEGRAVTDSNTIAVTGGPQIGTRFVVVYRHDGSQWTEEAILTGCPEEPSRMVVAAVQGDVLVATGADGDVGRLFVYRRDAAGTWALEAILTPADGAGLGSSVGIGGDRIFVTLGSYSGVAVFRYNPTLPDPTEPPTCSNLDPGKWRQKWTIPTPPDHRFYSLDVNRDGSRFVVGDNIYLRRGDLHVFNLVAGAWSERIISPYPSGTWTTGNEVAFGGSGPNADSILLAGFNDGFLLRAIDGGGYTQIAHRSQGGDALAGDSYFQMYTSSSVQVSAVNPTCTDE